MKFTLKDYQETAVGEVLKNLQKAAKRWREDGDIHAFSLSATTGAGKTVMAASVFEGLFYGDDNFDFEADPGAVVIWFSDDPSLNEQTRFRLLEASDKLEITDLVVVDNTFNREKFEPGKIYFLNTQKLSKSSILVRGHLSSEDDNPDQGELFPESKPDRRAYTIWDTIQNTVEDPALTLYLVLDEAHRGMGKSTAATQEAKSTIVKRLINGSGSVPAIPIVWGISATVSKFKAAIAEAKNRSTLPDVEVDSLKVQESGLLKDTIILDIPDKVGHFDSVLVRRGTAKIKESTKAWKEYAQEQGERELVVPLMVLQVPNTPNHDDLARALDTIYDEWPELSEAAIAHVFGERKALTFGRHAVPYIQPQRVQETARIRVLIAKDAISTGWDCPRAEVMVSFRPAIERVHITQLLGRMVRTPLARRIPGNERLNSVDCLLPFFDIKSVNAVVDALMNGGVEEGEPKLPGRKVLINPVEVVPNPAVTSEVWEKLVALPSQSLPKKGSKPVKRLTALAQELASDQLLADAGKKAHAEMHKVLDAAQARYADEITAAREAVLKVEGTSVNVQLQGKSKSFNGFVEDADFSVIIDFYKRAARSLSPDLAKTYADYLASKDKDASSKEEAIQEAYVDIASIGLVPEIQAYLDSEADKLAQSWLETYRVDFKGLSDERQDVYRFLRSWSKAPEYLDLVQPTSWMAATTVLENQTESPLPKYEAHLMCSAEDGLYPCYLNTWEEDILAREMSRSDFIAWYRNPGNATQDSLGIAYEENKEHHICRPDFIFFSKGRDGSIAVDIVDPHGHHYSDALPKLIGLAKYAETHSRCYRRIEMIAKIGEQLKVLDLTDAKVRAAVYEADSAKALYDSSLAYNY